MSTTDIRAAFEVAKAKMTRTDDGWTDFDMFEAGHKAATEAAKATGTAGELPPLPPYVKYALHCLAGEEAKAEAERQMLEYGQQCAKTAMAKVYAIAVEEKAKMDANAARQPAPVAVKTWQERMHADLAFREPLMPHEQPKYMEAEIADLRAALAATNRSQP